METIEPISSTSIRRPRVPPPTPAKPVYYVAPTQADEAGMRRWANDMLSGHPGGHATSFEQWGNSYVTQFKTVVDMMIQSLRIKEEAYSNIFNECAKECTEVEKSRRETLEEAQHLLDKAKTASANSEAAAEMIKYNESNRTLKVEADFLKEKLIVSADKLAKEVESNMNLFTRVKMAKESQFPSPTTDEERRRFLSQTNCNELLNPMDLKSNAIYCLDMLPMAVPIYGPEGVTFVKINNQYTVAMQMHLYSDSWDNLNIEELKEKQKRRRTTSGGSSTSPTDPQYKN